MVLAGVIKERQAEIDTMLSQDLAPKEGEGREEGRKGWTCHRSLQHQLWPVV